jgi:RimJ/RimL family protein N-acetyltransferase
MGRIGEPPRSNPLDQPADTRAIAEFEAQVAAGTVGHGIEADGEVACWGFSRTVTGDVPVPEANGALVPASRGDVVFAAFYTRIRHRGHGRYQELLAQMGHAAFAAGVPRAWIYAYTDNVPSCRAILRAGYVPVGRWEGWRLLGRRHTVWHAESASSRAALQSAGETSTRLS